MLALTQAQGLIIALGGAVLLAAAGGALLVGRRRKAAAAPEIPRSMRPGPADADLETPILGKLQGWGVLLVAFFVIWIPATWLFEPQANLNQENDLLTDSIARGSRAVQLYSEENQGGVGCVRCHGTTLQGSVILNTQTDPPTPLITPNLTTVCGGPWTGHARIYSLNDVYTTIEQGRLPIMPSWSIRYFGALDDQQINDLVNYIVSIQDKSQVPYKHNVCINKDATQAAIDQFLDGDVTKKPSPTNNVPL
jgi:mono/diheme cytochrome c family protein